MNIFDMRQNTRIKHIVEIGLTCPKNYILLIIFSVFFGLITPLIIQIQAHFIDYSMSTHNNIIAILAPMLVIYFLLNWVDLSSQNITSYLDFKIRNSIEKKIMAEYLDKISKLKFEEYENSKNQDLIYRIRETLIPVSIQGVKFIPTMLTNSIGLAGILYYTFVSGVWWIFPISIVLSIPSFHFNKKRANFARKVWAKDNINMRYSDYLHSILINRENAKERKLFQFTDFLNSRWDNIFKQYNKNKMMDYLKCSLATGIAMCFSMSNIIVFGLFLLKPLQEDVITIGLYISLLQMIVNKFNSNINSIINEITNLSKIKHFTQDLGEFKKLQFIEEDEKNRKIEFKSLKFDDVYFCYPHTERFILKGISFEIKNGEHYALIGLNGEGKTTITKLIMGLYKPTKGQIYINGVDILEYSYNQLRNIFVCMQQELVNYKMTARENIGLFRLNDSEINENIDEILERCKIFSLKSKLNDNYNTQLTPELNGGTLLSGGEWQKIGIARTIFSQREFYILDEPTAALDPLAEVEFYKNFKELIGDDTCLYITHRLGSTYLFDKCLVLNNGVIEETGSHHELMEKSDGLYKELYDTQRKWYEVNNDEII